MRNLTRYLLAASALTVAFALPACGDDDDSDSGSGDAASSTTADTTSTSAPSGTTAGGDSESSFPSDEFCDAVADLQAAQDGAQRNQALGDMAEAAGADIPPAISQAIENLDTGDLPTEAYAAAEQALEAVCN
jgi:hypothetical protein